MESKEEKNLREKNLTFFFFFFLMKLNIELLFFNTYFSKGERIAGIGAP